MDAVTLNNSVATDTTYFEDEENGFDISSIFNEGTSNWANEFNLTAGETLPENILNCCSRQTCWNVF